LHEAINVVKETSANAAPAVGPFALLRARLDELQPKRSFGPPLTDTLAYEFMGAQQ